MIFILWRKESLVPKPGGASPGSGAARAKGVRLGRPTSLHKRADEVLALKKKGLGLRAISRQLGMAVSSVHSILAGRKAKR
jgi:DNA-binding CsgD family transcriptional regulator